MSTYTGSDPNPAPRGRLRKMCKVQLRGIICSSRLFLIKICNCYHTGSELTQDVPAALLNDSGLTQDVPAALSVLLDSELTQDVPAAPSVFGSELSQDVPAALSAYQKILYWRFRNCYHTGSELTQDVPAILLNDSG